MGFNNTFNDVFGNIFGSKLNFYSENDKKVIDYKYKMKKANSPYRLFRMKSGTHKIMTPDMIEVFSCECEYEAKLEFIKL